MGLIAIAIGIERSALESWRAKRSRFREATQDVLQACGAITEEENTDAKRTLDRIVAMLTKLGRRGYREVDN